MSREYKCVLKYAREGVSVSLIKKLKAEFLHLHLFTSVRRELREDKLGTEKKASSVKESLPYPTS